MSSLSKPRALPLLDMRALAAGGEARARFLVELRTAAREVGFFYLAGHGIPEARAAELVRLAWRFFALPEEEKLAIEMVNSPHFVGYTRAGWERTRGRSDWREQIDFGPEVPALPVTPDLPPWMRLQGPNQWPESLPELRPALLAWQADLSRLTFRLLEAFAAALEQEEDAFAPIYGDTPNARMKLIRYPGREATPDDQGVGPHKDSGFLTFLLQDQEPGLQVETDTGWVDAAPVPGTFVVNIGELLELATNGYLRATTHRVITPPAGRQRLSIAFFLGARLDAEVPLLTLPPALAAEARGPASDPLNPLFRDIGRNYLKGRLRSHPDVAQRHYADLLAQQAG